ncbi:HNH endonuclease [Halopelagius fulvigenes]|uniref:HNH endonuclease n=1 Tax=Halopelagius fulvigenes TaxID=1198324 RepID=A0ABD5TTI0_9EURY
MYLPTKLVNLMGVTFDEVNRPYKLEGTPLQKNRHYRPLVLRLGLEALEEMDDDEIRDRLEDDDLLDDPPE